MSQDYSACSIVVPSQLVFSSEKSNYVFRDYFGEGAVYKKVRNIFIILFVEGTSAGSNKTSFLLIFRSGRFICENKPHEDFVFCWEFQLL